MEEAERLCDRIGIVDRGELKAEGTRQELVRLVGELDQVTLTATGSLEETAGALAALPAVSKAAVTGEGITLNVQEAHGQLPEIMAVASRTGTMVNGVEVDTPDLESVFLTLTGRALRE